MVNLIIFNIFLYIAVLLLSLLIIFISKKGYLTLRFKNYCLSNSLGEFIILLFIISGIIMFILHILLIILIPAFLVPGGGTLIINKSGLVLMVNDTNTQDPVRWWPSGTPQTWSILGTALGVYRLVPGNPRIKTMAALSSLGLTIPSTVYFHAIENPNGFNRLMYSWMKYKQTGNWPSNIPNTVQDNDISEIIPNIVFEAESKYNLLKNSISTPSSTPSSSSASSSSSSSISTSSSSSSSFLPEDFNNFLDNLIPNQLGDNFLKNILAFFRPVETTGYLDDLIGQQLFIHILLFIIVISLIILLTIFFFIQIMVNNKEFLLNKFKNKFILFFIKYQLILGKISSVVLPLLIMFGLLELLIGLYFIITHPIPYEKLGTDLHIFIK